MIACSTCQQVWVSVTNEINPKPSSPQHTGTAFEECWVHSRGEPVLGSPGWVWAEQEVWFTANSKPCSFPIISGEMETPLCLLCAAQGTGGGRRDPGVSSCHALGTLSTAHLPKGFLWWSGIGKMHLCPTWNEGVEGERKVSGLFPLGKGQNLTP